MTIVERELGNSGSMSVWSVIAIYRQLSDKNHCKSLLD